MNYPVYIINNLDTLARANYTLNRVEVSPEFIRLPKWEQKLILLHEEGHFEGNQGNEIGADEYAFYKFIGTEKQSLKKTIAVLEKNLSKLNPEHRKRLREAKRRAIIADITRFNNEKLKSMIDTKRNESLIIEINPLVKRIKKNRDTDSPQIEDVTSIEQESPKNNTLSRVGKVENPEGSEKFNFKSEWVVYVMIGLIIVTFGIAFFKFRR